MPLSSFIDSQPIPLSNQTSNSPPKSAPKNAHRSLGVHQFSRCDPALSSKPGHFTSTHASLLPPFLLHSRSYDQTGSTKAPHSDEPQSNLQHLCGKLPGTPKLAIQERNLSTPTLSPIVTPKDQISCVAFRKNTLITAKSRASRDPPSPERPRDLSRPSLRAGAPARRATWMSQWRQGRTFES